MHRKAHLLGFQLCFIQQQQNGKPYPRKKNRQAPNRAPQKITALQSNEENGRNIWAKRIDKGEQRPLFVRDMMQAQLVQSRGSVSLTFDIPAVALD